MSTRYERKFDSISKKLEKARLELAKKQKKLQEAKAAAEKEQQQIKQIEHALSVAARKERTKRLIKTGAIVEKVLEYRCETTEDLERLKHFLTKYKDNF